MPRDAPVETLGVLAMPLECALERRYACLNVWVNLMEADQILDIYDKAISEQRRLLVGSVNLHMVSCYRWSDAVRAFFARADLIYVDGMPVVWWLKCLGEPARARHRATFVDWLPALLERARDRGWRVYYLGGRPGVTAKVAALFEAQLPGLKMRAGHGHFDHSEGSAESRRVVEDINGFRPHILLVGMGTPLQQSWVVRNASQLDAPVIHACGATADYFARVIPFPPRVLGRLGLEGVFRLISEPRRLWRRYMVEPLLLFDLALRDLRRVYFRSNGD